MNADHSLHTRTIEAPVQAVEKYARRTRNLTLLVLIIGTLSLLASLLLVSGFWVVYKPKQQQLMKELGALAAENLAAEHRAREAGSSPRALQDRFPGIQVYFNYGIWTALILLSTAVGLLGLGTLTLLSLILVNRRIALEEVSRQLAEISNQLRNPSRNPKEML